MFDPLLDEDHCTWLWYVSGLLTKQLAKLVPRGKVSAVDIDSNMITQAKITFNSLIILK
jgi:trans-aconitate methyltransferase